MAEIEVHAVILRDDFSTFYEIMPSMAFVFSVNDAVWLNKTP